MKPTQCKCGGNKWFVYTSGILEGGIAGMLCISCGNMVPVLNSFIENVRRAE